MDEPREDEDELLPTFGGAGSTCFAFADAHRGGNSGGYDRHDAASVDDKDHQGAGGLEPGVVGDDRGDAKRTASDLCVEISGQDEAGRTAAE